MRQIRSAWVRRKSRERKLFRFVGATILLFTLVASGFYVFDMISNQGACKIYVDGFSSGGTNNGKGIKLTYDPSYGSGYSNLNGKGIRVESSSYRGMSFSTQSLKDHTGKVYKNCLAYLMSVASNDENTVNTLGVSNQYVICEIAFLNLELPMSILSFGNFFPNTHILIYHSILYPI